MPADKELDQALAELAEFRTANEHQHKSLGRLLQKYTELVGDYKRLRSDYEEERDSRERYKQIARGQERNPFVLVLIHGDGYIFDDDLVSNGTEGGQKAAGLLSDVVKNSLRWRGLDHCRIMVRVYANLSGLSKALSKAKLAGPEKRSLAPFVASFNRSNDLFDFGDAGELKEGADSKLRAMFRQFAENTQCRHIYFAGCHDVGYISELTPYVGNRDRITLVRSPTHHAEFSKLGMRIEDFPNIFRSMPLEAQNTIISIKTPPPPKNSRANNSSSCRDKPGACRYMHVKSNTNGSAANARSLSDLKDWRGARGELKLPSHPPHSAKGDDDFTGRSSIPADPLQLQIALATMLPKDDSFARNELPINKHQHRLDVYIPPPSPAERAAFQARIAVQKLCNNHHILSNCPHPGDCEYDHNPVSPAMLNCLKQVTRNNPCPRKGACRWLSCLNGHICQRVDCKWRGGKQYCKFDLHAHTQPLEVAGFVQGIGQRGDAEPDSAESESTSKSSASPIVKPHQHVDRGDDRDDDQQPFEDAVLNL